MKFNTVLQSNDTYCPVAKYQISPYPFYLDEYYYDYYGLSENEFENIRFNSTDIDVFPGVRGEFHWYIIA